MTTATDTKAARVTAHDHNAPGRAEVVAAVRALYEHVMGEEEGAHDESVGEGVYWRVASLELPAGLARDISLLLPPRYRAKERAPVRIVEVLNALDRVREVAGLQDTARR